MLQWFVDDSCRGEDPRVPIGYPLSGNTLAIVDEDDQPTPRGDVGELIVASPYVALGRWADGRCADDSMEARGERGWRLFRTGDLVRQRRDGLLERVGRKDRQVKIRGTLVDLDGVEAALRGHPGVRDVAALGRTSGADGTSTLVAYVVAHDESPAGLIDELREFMRAVPSPLRPSRLYLREEIPRLPSSKLDVRGLMVQDDATVRGELATLTARADLIAMGDDRIAETVARVWAQVVRAPVGGPDDDFFDSGGDSLTAMTFTLELEHALRIEVPLTLVNESPTFGELCDRLRECRAPRSVPLVPLKAGAGLPPLFFIHGVGGHVGGMLATARRMTYAGAIIGIRARGLARGEWPHSSVEAMAIDYLREIKARQPHGPYYLCGYSFGGLVAFEIARRLLDSGNEVGLVGLFDTRMSPLRWPLRAWLSVLRRRARPAAIVRATPLRTWPALARVIPVAASALMASARYRPGFYPGHLTVFGPATRPPGLPSLEATWGRHAATLSVVETAGDHATMLSAPHDEATAASVMRCLLRTAEAEVQ